MKIAIINGPNLNLTGSREPGIYGHKSFKEFLEELEREFREVQFFYFQSNLEGEIIDQIQQYGGEADGIILNAGGYTHTSVAIADAVKAISIPVVEVHISNIFSREDYRHVSFFGKHAIGTIAGFGLESYRLAVRGLLNSR